MPQPLPCSCPRAAFGGLAAAAPRIAHSRSSPPPYVKLGKAGGAPAQQIANRIVQPTETVHPPGVPVGMYGVDVPDLDLISSITAVLDSGRPADGPTDHVVNLERSAIGCHGHNSVDP